LSLSREATSLIRPDVKCTDLVKAKLSPSRETTSLIMPDFKHTEIVKYNQINLVKGGHPSYMATSLISQISNALS
jgi:hypothetical protein